MKFCAEAAKMAAVVLGLALLQGLFSGLSGRFGPAAAQGLEPRYSPALQGVQSVSLAVAGRISDDACWPEPGETKAEVAARLRMRGLNVIGEGLGPSELYLFVQGYSIDDGKTCVWFVDLTHLGWSGPYRLLRGDKTMAQVRVRESFFNLVDIFIADWAHSNGKAEGH